MLTFLLSPVGRWIAGGVGALLVVGLLYKNVTDTAYQNGLEDGKHAATLQLTKDHEKEVTMLNQKLVAQAKDIAALQVKVSVKRDLVNKKIDDVKRKVDNDVAVIVSTPPDPAPDTPCYLACAACEAEVKVLVQDVQLLEAALTEAQVQIVEEQKLADAQVAGLNSQLLVMTSDRDYYKDAYNHAMKRPSKLRRFLHKLTLGLVK